MTVATFTQPDYTTQTASQYKANLDGAAMVFKRMAGPFAAHAQTSPDMTVRLDAGALFAGTTLTEVAAQNTGTITAPVTNPRIDRIVIDAATGAVSVIAGTEAASPAAPSITSGKLPVAQVLLATSSTSITNSMLTDERVPGMATVTTATPPVRQTVLSGPVDSAGLASFGGSTGSTTVTASGTLVASAAAGGASNYTGTITNPSWTGLSTNGTMYLYLDITASGVVSAGSVTLAPTYQWGGTYSTTSNQHTFNIQEMTLKVGNGASASQVYRVFVGEVTVAANVVSAITWYALMGRYRSAWTATLPGAATKTSASHNIGVIPDLVRFKVRNNSTEGNYAVGDIITPGINIGSGVDFLPVLAKALTMSATSGSSGWSANDATTGAGITLTAAKWDYRFEADRGW